MDCRLRGQECADSWLCLLLACGIRWINGLRPESFNKFEDRSAGGDRKRPFIPVSEHGSLEVDPCMSGIERIRFEDLCSCGHTDWPLGSCHAGALAQVAILQNDAPVAESPLLAACEPRRPMRLAPKAARVRQIVPRTCNRKAIYR